MKKELRVIEDSFVGVYFEDPQITDVSFNGTALYIQHNKKGRIRADRQPSTIEVFQLIKRIADIQGKNFTATNPILDTEFGNFRINALHDCLTEGGVTFSIRCSPEKLVIERLADVSNGDIEKLLGVLVKAKANFIISGATGSGKTEVQKMLVAMIPNFQKITLIEDTLDLKVKAIFPEKDINSWHTLKEYQREHRITEHELIKAGLRNNPDWLIVSETRGTEAYDLLESALTGHSIITTIHAKMPNQIPNRLIRMVGKGFQVNEMLLGKDIVDILDIGIHLCVECNEFGVKRFINEVVEYESFDGNGVNCRSLYKKSNRFDDKSKMYVGNELYSRMSEQMIQRLIDNKLLHEVPDIFWKN